MPSLAHVGAVALTLLPVAPLPGHAQSGYGSVQGGARVVALPEAADGRIDRSVVSPFDGRRRVVVRPEGLPAPEAVPPSDVTPGSDDVVGLSVPERGSYISIGSLDRPDVPAPDAAPASEFPCGADCPSDTPEFIDIGPYDGIGTLDPVSPFPPE